MFLGRHIFLLTRVFRAMRRLPAGVALVCPG
jgi:hypothetical protein